MKTPQMMSALILLSLAGPILAESDAWRELKQLHEQREKAVAAAVEPINRRYQTALEQLLRRAMQSGDLETAVSIKNELSVLGATGGDEGKTAFELALTSNAWTWTIPGGRSVLRFKPDGNVVGDWSFKARWAITGSRTVTVHREKGTDTAVLKFNEALTAYTARDFDGQDYVRGERQ
jgi:hypothetical protein